MSMSDQVRPIEILMVEDSPTDALLTKEALNHSKLCNNLHHVMDGAAALDFLHQRAPYDARPRPDLILLDLNLPKKDGQGGRINRSPSYRTR